MLKYGVTVKKTLLRSITRTPERHKALYTVQQTKFVTYIVITRKLKPKTVNTKAGNLTRQGVKEWNDEGTDKESGSPPLPHLPEVFHEVHHLFRLY